MKRYFWLFAVLTLGWMTFIFCMSAQSITESKETSGSLTLFLAQLLYGKGTVLTESMLEPVSILVRKTAHMAAYAILFLLSYGSVYFYKKSLSAKLIWLMAYGWTVFYAITDEIHQIFSGRGALVADVIIDALGALIGVMLVLGFRKIKGWGVVALLAAFGIYVLTFFLFHPEVLGLLTVK